jgi:hypothetical protein
VAPFWSAAIPLPLFNLGVISRPGAARPRADSDGVTPVPPFLLGHRSPEPIIRVSDDDGFVRPKRELGTGFCIIRLNTAYKRQQSRRHANLPAQFLVAGVIIFQLNVVIALDGVKNRVYTAFSGGIYAN